MTDVHCHLNFKSFRDDFYQVIKNAEEKGVKRIINVGTSIESSIWSIRLSEKYKNLFSIVGIHPHHADKVSKNWVEELSKIAKNPKVIAIGEIGMDFYEYKSNGIVDPKIQEEIFTKQIELSIKLNLPLQIHNRQAGENVIKILNRYKSKLLKTPGMFHCFASSKEVLKQALEMGFYIGFDGNITYKGIAKGESEKLSDLALLAPVNRIVVETDSPYLTPEPLRGERNEPANAIITASFIANLKNIDKDRFIEITEENTEKIFPKIK